MSGFTLHALTAGQGILAISQMPGRSGDYAADLATVREWKPSYVLTMTPEAEMIPHGAMNFGAHMQDSGTRWAYLPTDDYGVLPEDLAAEWARASAQCRAALRGGGRVLIHCMGGCGRSGMAALRLLIEMGEDPEAALDRLRAKRPCAVETARQLQWAMAGEKQPDPVPRSLSDIPQD
ncbi:protein-tyrosine phosphatase family protein [Mesobacterium pallidum]|uniref:protein-tyrosine phosphatase family protein n=1 Tax=Mesobacterium pallidum TaxID=2872037 RepID=UPI001EE38EA8|nr:protein-tyrosine phosphatase family protein [Mesobacterium pallidum]